MDRPFPAYQGQDPYTFVCYAHADAKVVYPEITWLREQGINVWYDEGISAGSNWRASVGDSLINARNVLVYLSKASLGSDHCNREINLALDEGKEVIPVYLEPVALSADLKVGLTRVHALHREQDADYPQRLLKALGSTRVGADSVGSFRKISAASRRRVDLLQRLVLVLAIGVLGVVTGAWLNSPESDADEERPTRRFAIDIGKTESLLGGGWPMLSAEFAISPDGSKLVYFARKDGVNRMYLRHLDSLESTVLSADGSDGDAGLAPFFSPDGEWVGYYAIGERGWDLMKISLADGRTQTITDAFPQTGGAWLPDNTIIHPNNPRGGAEFGEWPDGHWETLYRVDASGGEPRQLTRVDQSEGLVGHMRPCLLPGGTHLLFDRKYLDEPPDGLADRIARAKSDVALLDLTTGETRVLITNAGGAQYLSSGHIAFVRDGAVWAVAFGLDALEIRGSPAMIEGPVNAVPLYGNLPLVVAEDGAAVWLPAPAEGVAQRRPVWVDRQGRVQTTGIPAGPYRRPRVSPSGNRIALVHEGPGQLSIWMHDVQRPGSLFRITPDSANNSAVAWGRDGRYLYFSSDRNGQANLYRMRSDGADAPYQLSASERPQFADTVAPDGTTLMFSAHDGRSFNMHALALQDGAAPTTVLATEFHEGSVSFSPDGKWIAYGSNEGESQGDIYVRPYPNLQDGKWQISTDGGLEAFWSPSGNEIFYRNDGKFYAVEVSTKPTFSPGLPQMLFEGDYYANPFGAREYDVVEDGEQRFLLLEELPERVTTQLIFVENWQAKVKRLVPR